MIPVTSLRQKLRMDILKEREQQLCLDNLNCKEINIIVIPEHLLSGFRINSSPHHFQ